MNPRETKSHVSPKKILLATDFSPASEAALPYALTIARQYGSKLYIAHVISPEFRDLVPSEATAAKVQEAQQVTQQNMARLLRAVSPCGISCQSLIGQGAIWDTLLEMVHENGIDLIVVGTHGRRGKSKLLLGSVAEEVFRMAPCPVLTVGPKASEMRSMDVHLDQILYPVEFVPDTSDAAAYAVSLAEEFHAKLTFMKVLEETLPSPEEKAQVQEPVSHWIDDHISTESDLRERTSFELGFGPAAEAILKFASDRGMDLIVMDVRRLDPVMAGHFPKPDKAYQVVCTASCPVLTVY